MGQRLRDQRTGAGLTQDQLGKRAGIVGKYVSEIERGTRDIPFSTLHAIVEHGLRRRLEVRFAAAAERGARGGKRPSLPRGIERLARTIADLPGERRARVVAVVRALLRVTR